MKVKKKKSQAFLILRNEDTRAQWWNAVRTPKRCADQKQKPAGCRFHHEDPKVKKAIAVYSILQNSVNDRMSLLSFSELNACLGYSYLDHATVFFGRRGLSLEVFWNEGLRRKEQWALKK